MNDQPKLQVVASPTGETSIQKPAAFDLEKFKSKATPTVAGVETLLTVLPHHPLSHAKDFVGCTLMLMPIGRQNFAS